LAIFLAVTCSTADVQGECPTVPKDGSRQANMLAEGRQQAVFPILFPCKLPNSQALTAVSVVGDSGRQSVTITWDGPFQITVRQSQLAPVVNADPAGASHSVIRNLFPGTDADLIEINDGSSHAIYHLVWARSGMYYEVLVAGPPQQRKVVLDIALSLSELA